MSRSSMGCLLASSLLVSCADSTTPLGEDRDVLARNSATFHVALGAPDGGDGSGAFPFASIQDGVDAALAAGGGIVHVGPGHWLLDDPILIMGSGITLKGDGPDATILENDPGFDPTQSMVRAGCYEYQDGECPPARAGGTLPAVLRDVEFSGFTVKSSLSRNAVMFVRVQDFVVKDNVFEGPSPTRRAFGGFGSNASSGRVVDNWFGYFTLGLGVRAGYPAPAGEEDLASPAEVDVVANTFVDNQEGFMPIGTPTAIPQRGGRIVASARDNVFVGNDFGARVVAGIRPYSWPGGDDQSGDVIATFTGNYHQDEDTPYAIDGGFLVYRNEITDPDAFAWEFDPNPLCATRWFTARLQVSLDDEIAGPGNGPSQISFTRPDGEGLANYAYLHFAEFDIADPDDVLGTPLVNHPEYDPRMDIYPDIPPDIDPCREDRKYDVVGGPGQAHPGTEVHPEGRTLALALGNTLTIDGEVMGFNRLHEDGVDCIDEDLAHCFATCGDLADNDGDGAIDNGIPGIPGVADAIPADPDCEDTCTDQVDNDDDMALDGDDPSCTGSACGDMLGCAVACAGNTDVPSFLPPGSLPAGLYCQAYECPLGLRGPAAICDVTPVDPFTWFMVLFNGGNFQGNPWSVPGGPNTQRYNAVLGCAQAAQTPPAARPPWMPNVAPPLGACLLQCSPPSNACLPCIIAVCQPEIAPCVDEICTEGP